MQRHFTELKKPTTLRSHSVAEGSDAASKIRAAQALFFGSLDKPKKIWQTFELRHHQCLKTAHPNKHSNDHYL